MRLIYILLILFLTACQTKIDTHYYFDRNHQATLPSLEKAPNFILQQLLTVKIPSAPQQESILTVLELSPELLKFNLFSPLGISLAQLEYNGNTLQVKQQLAIAQQNLPPVNQVVGDILLSILPVEYWQPYLPDNWKLVQYEKQRRLLDNRGESVIVIEYDKSDSNQVVSIQHNVFNYNITIQTLFIEYK